MSSSRCCLVLPRQAAALMPCTRGHLKVFSRRARSTSIIASIAGASQAGPRSPHRGRLDGHAGYLIAGSAFGRYVASPHTRGPILPGTRNFWKPCMSWACIQVASTLAIACYQHCSCTRSYRIRKPPSRKSSPAEQQQMSHAITRAKTKETPHLDYLRSTCPRPI